MAQAPPIRQVEANHGRASIPETLATKATTIPAMARQPQEMRRGLLGAPNVLMGDVVTPRHAPLAAVEQEQGRTKWPMAIGAPMGRLRLLVSPQVPLQLDRRHEGHEPS